MTEGTSPEKLRKFLLSEDPAMRLMGISMAKGINLLESNQIVYALLLWDSELKVKSSAREFVEEIGSENIIDREQAKDEGVPDWAGDEGILVSQLSTSVLLSFLKSSNEDMKLQACMAFVEVGQPRKNDSSDTLVKELVSFLKGMLDKLITKQGNHGYWNLSEIDTFYWEYCWEEDNFEGLINVICKGVNLEDTKKQIEGLKSSLEIIWDYNNRDFWTRWMETSEAACCPPPDKLVNAIVDLEKSFWPEEDRTNIIGATAEWFLSKFVDEPALRRLIVHDDYPEEIRLYIALIDLLGDFGSLDSCKELLISFLDDDCNERISEHAAGALESLGVSEEEFGYKY